METKIKHIDEFEKELEIILTWNEVGEEYNDLLKRYAKIPVKGFRPGKIPAGITESTFRDEIKNDLVAACSTRFCRKALKEQGLEAGSPIEINDVELQRDHFLSFKAHFIEMPKFDLPDYANLDIQATTEEEILDEISEKLLAQTVIHIHPVLIENELNFSDIEQESPSNEEKEAAEQRVKLMLILKKIASQDNIESNEKDAEDRIRLIANENGMHADEVKEFLVSNGGLGRLADSLLAENVLGYIRERNEGNV